MAFGEKMVSKMCGMMLKRSVWCMVHGAKNVQHGSTNVLHGAKNVRHCPKNVRHGAKNV